MSNKNKENYENVKKMKMISLNKYSFERCLKIASVCNATSSYISGNIFGVSKLSKALVWSYCSHKHN